LIAARRCDQKKERKKVQNKLFHDVWNYNKIEGQQLLSIDLAEEMQNSSVYGAMYAAQCLRLHMAC